MKRFLVFLLTLCFLLCGCGKAQISAPPEAGPETRELSDPAIPEKTAISTEAFIIGDFAAPLLQESFDGEKNILVSPLSVMAALGMTATGAGNDTLAQMEAVLGAPIASLNQYMQGYLAHIGNSEGAAVHCANSLWIKDIPDFLVRDDFLQTNERFYGAGVYRAPFDTQTLADINGWVKEHTDGMIENILDDIPESAVLYLVNALSFEAQWMQIYQDFQVQEGCFTTESGLERPVEMMHSKEHLFLENEYATGFMKEYEGNYAFAVLLPKEGISMAQLTESLSGDLLSATLKNPQERVVFAQMPKFQAEYSTELSEVLTAMGMADAFYADRADFTGIGTMAGGDNLYIGRVLHKTKICVDTEGTKAGAATVVEMPAMGAYIPPEEIREVNLDRPFLYMVIDCRYHEPLFIGALMDPGN